MLHCRLLDFSFCGNAQGIQAMLKAVFSKEPGGRLQGFLYF
jgi:hypothetical protein